MEGDATPRRRPPKTQGRDAQPNDPGVVEATQPEASPAVPSPDKVRPVVLAHDEPDHLMILGADETLCGAYVHGGAYQISRYDGRRTCRDCRRLAKVQGLKVESGV